jgi:hypothetical protein
MIIGLISIPNLMKQLWCHCSKSIKNQYFITLMKVQSKKKSKIRKDSEDEKKNEDLIFVCVFEHENDTVYGIYKRAFSNILTFHWGFIVQIIAKYILIVHYIIVSIVY